MSIIPSLLQGESLRQQKKKTNKKKLGYSSLEALDTKVSMVLASTVSCDRSFQSDRFGQERSSTSGTGYGSDREGRCTAVRAYVGLVLWRGEAWS